MNEDSGKLETGTVRIYNRPAKVEKRTEEKSVVRWMDNGTQGVVWTGDIET